MRSTEIKQRQTLIDFTCQNSGSIEALFDVAQENGVSITEEIAPGTQLSAPEIDRKTVAFYQKSIHDITTDQNVQPVQGGIGFMQIGTTFKVS